MEWISVDERLPEVDDRVLYWFPPFNRAYIGTFGGGTCAANVHFYSRGGFTTGDVTHWMPLPKAPALQEEAKFQKT